METKRIRVIYSERDGEERVENEGTGVGRSFQVEEKVYSKVLQWVGA